MKVTTSKSKNAESFYISKSFINDKGVSTSVNVRKLGTLTDLLKEHGPTRDDVMKWARAEAKLETQKYKKDKIVNISFNSSKRLQPQQQVFYRVGYLFLQYFYYKLGLHKVCRKIRDKYSFKFDINSILKEFDCQKFIYCSDAGLGSEKIRKYNHMGERAFVVTQSIKKLNAQDRQWALDTKGFKRLSDDKVVDLAEISKDDETIYYKDAPYTPKDLSQRLIITYSPKYAKYQKTIREKQVDRAKLMLEKGSIKKERRNPNDPARFLGSIAVTDDGEKANVHNFLNTDKIDEEAKYDGMYAISTDLLDDNVSEILSISEKRWQIEECFRIMKTEFEARPVFLQRTDRITSHFLTCFLALIIYRYLEKFLEHKYTCEEILKTLKDFNFAYVKDQGFIPLYKRTELTDKLHEICHFNTDFEFITKSQMRTIQKQSKGK